MERRGFVSLGQFVPTVVLDDPNALKQLHREFINCGSDIVLAFTYYAHKERLAKVGKEQLVAEINVRALQIAREVIAEPGNEHCILAGNICNTNMYVPNDPQSTETVLEMFRDQCRIAKEGCAELIVAETICFLGEAELALQAINEVGLPSVINLCFPKETITQTADGIPTGEAQKRLKELGATVVGSNCHQGPEDMLKVGKIIREAVQGPISLLPITQRTCGCGFFSLENHDLTKKDTSRAFPDSMEQQLSTRGEIREFGVQAKELGVQFVGLCCGSSPQLLRSLCNGIGKPCKADANGVDMSSHFKFGEKTLKIHKEEYFDKKD